MFVEVRPKVPVEVAAVIDAACKHDSLDRGGRIVSRDEKVNQILREWAVREHRKATLIVSTVGINPLESDGGVD